MNKRKNKRKQDYVKYWYFEMGIVFFVLGIATRISPFFITGMAFIAIGLAYKSKKTNKKR